MFVIRVQDPELKPHHDVNVSNTVGKHLAATTPDHLRETRDSIKTEAKTPFLSSLPATKSCLHKT
jgi:hypothetical protein